MDKNILLVVTVAISVFVTIKSSSSTTPELRPIKFFLQKSSTASQHQPTNPNAQSTSTTPQHPRTHPNAQSSSTTPQHQPTHPNAQSSTTPQHQPTNPNSQSSSTTPQHQPTNPNAQSSSTTPQHQPTNPNAQPTSTTHQYQPTNLNAQSASSTRHHQQHYLLIFNTSILSAPSCQLLESPCTIGYTFKCEATSGTIMCIHRCIIEDRVCQNKGDCLYDSRENITFCLCKEDSHNVYKGDHCEVKVEKLALESKYIAAIAGSIGGAIVIAAITAIMCVVYRLRKKNIAEGNVNHVGLMDYKECTSHKKQARSNTNWKAPVESGTNDLHPYATSTDRDTPLPRGVSVSHPPERRKASSPQSYKHGTEMEEPDKHREHYYHPYAKNTYWDVLNARSSRDSHPYSSYREVRKAERTMEEHKHDVAAGFIGPKRSQLKIPNGAHVHQTQLLHSTEADLYRSVNSSSHYDYIGAVSHAEGENM